jgi:hypothetical protein
VISDFNLLSDFSLPITRESNPLLLPGPVPGNPVAMRQFTNIEQWRQYVLGLQLQGKPLQAIRSNYERMLRVLFLAWLDVSVVKLAELAALASLEVAIGRRYDKKFRGLETALKYLIEEIGVTDADLRTFRESGGSVVSNLLRKPQNGGSALSEIRNRLAHGDPFEVTPWSGLFEVVRDLLDFMYPSVPSS